MGFLTWALLVVTVALVAVVLFVVGFVAGRLHCRRDLRRTSCLVVGGELFKTVAGQMEREP